MVQVHKEATTMGQPPVDIWCGGGGSTKRRDAPDKAVLTCLLPSVGGPCHANAAMCHLAAMQLQEVPEACLVLSSEPQQWFIVNSAAGQAAIQHKDIKEVLLGLEDALCCACGGGQDTNLESAIKCDGIGSCGVCSQAMYVRFDLSSSMSETLMQNRGCVSMSTSMSSRRLVIRQVHRTTWHAQREREREEGK